METALTILLDGLQFSSYLFYCVRWTNNYFWGDENTQCMSRVFTLGERTQRRFL